MTSAVQPGRRVCIPVRNGLIELLVRNNRCDSRYSSQEKGDSALFPDRASQVVDILSNHLIRNGIVPGDYSVHVNA